MEADKIPGYGEIEHGSERKKKRAVTSPRRGAPEKVPTRSMANAQDTKGKAHNQIHHVNAVKTVKRGGEIASFWGNKKSTMLSRPKGAKQLGPCGGKSKTPPANAKSVRVIDRVTLGKGRMTRRVTVSTHARDDRGTATGFQEQSTIKKSDLSIEVSANKKKRGGKVNAVRSNNLRNGVTASGN